MQVWMGRARVNTSGGESDLYSPAPSANVWWEIGWWLITTRKRLSIQNEKYWFQDEALVGPHRSEVKEKILLHSQLPLVSYLAGKNRRKTQQDHNRKCFPGESERCLWSIVSKAALRSRRCRMETKPESEAVRSSLKIRWGYLSTVFFAISLLEGVPNIALIQITKKLVKKKNAQ